MVKKEKKAVLMYNEDMFNMLILLCHAALSVRNKSSGRKKMHKGFKTFSICNSAEKKKKIIFAIIY